MKTKTLEQLEIEECALYDGYYHGMTKKENEKLNLKIEKFRNKKWIELK